MAPERPSFTAAGYGVDAVIAGATVNVFSWQHGAKGELLGRGGTDENGYYSIRLKAPNQPVLLELSGGYYTEEASGKKVQLTADQRLYAVQYYSGMDLTVMITPITTLAAGLAQYLVANDGYNAENAITFGTSAMTGIFGFNCLETYPINITEPDSITGDMSDGHLYGFYAAAMSSWTADISETNGQEAHDTYTSIYLAQLMYNDIRTDGALDGHGTNTRGDATKLFMGAVALNSQAYRQMIGHHLIIAADADYNATGLGVDDIIEPARIYSQRVNAIFASEPPLPLDAEGPRIFNVPSEVLGRYYTGNIEYSFIIEDLVGIADMQVDIDGDPLDAALPETTKEVVTVEIDTTIYADGQHKLTVSSTDMLGNSSEHSLYLKSNNTGITITEITNAGLTRVNPFVISGRYEVSQGSSLVEILVGGHVAAIDPDEQTWSYQLPLEPGHNDITITATDTRGVATTITASVDLDTISPSFYTGDDHGAHRFYIGDGEKVEKILHDETSPEGFPLYFNFYNTSLNGIAITRADLTGAEIPFFRFILSDPDDNGVSTPVGDMAVTMTYQLHGQVMSEMRLVPVADTDNEYIIPLVTEYLGDFYNCDEEDLHYITIQTMDAAGNKTVKIFTFKAYVDSPEIKISSLNAASDVSVYDWSNGAKGALITTGRTDKNGDATINLFAESKPLLVELSGGKYKELATGADVSMSDHALSAVINFDEADMNAAVTPLTHIASSLAVHHAGNGTPAQEAVDTANDTVSGIYGVDVIETPLVDISDAVNATSQCDDKYKYTFTLAGLSQWTFDAAYTNGTNNQNHYNSLLLADRMAVDVANDGMLNSAPEFGVVALNTAVYTQGFGDAIFKAIGSRLNATQLTTSDFLKASFAEWETPDFTNIAFGQRAQLVGKPLEVKSTTISNNTTTPLMVAIADGGGQNQCTHQYSAEKRFHTVLEKIEHQYRAKGIVTYGGYRYKDQYCSITSYDTYEGDPYKNIDTWVKHDLVTVVNNYLDHKSDQLPTDATGGWTPYITELVGQPHDLTGPMYLFVDYRFDCGSGHDYAWFAIYPGDWWINVTEVPKSITDSLVTPQIEHRVLHKYYTADGPAIASTPQTSVIAFDNTISVTLDDGSTAATSGGSYIIPPMKTAIITKATTLPVITLYADGEPTYTMTNYDKAISWMLDKTLRLSFHEPEDNSIAAQAPRYNFGGNKTDTYTIAK